MKTNYLFLLGRPGAGKTTVYLALERHLRQRDQARALERVDDWPKLWARFKADDAREPKGQERVCSLRTSEGAYTLTDRSVLDDILQEVSSDVQGVDQPEHRVVIEFARPRYVEALRNFHPRILERCLVVYVDASFETCQARNIARREAGASGDDHVIAPEAMDAVFRHDDREALVQHLQERGIPVLVMDNEAEGEEHLQKQVERLVEELL